MNIPYSDMNASGMTINMMRNDKNEAYFPNLSQYEEAVV